MRVSVLLFLVAVTAWAYLWNLCTVWKTELCLTEQLTLKCLNYKFHFIQPKILKELEHRLRWVRNQEWRHQRVKQAGSQFFESFESFGTIKNIELFERFTRYLRGQCEICLLENCIWGPPIVFYLPEVSLKEHILSFGKAP